MRARQSPSRTAFPIRGDPSGEGTIGRLAVRRRAIRDEDLSTLETNDGGLVLEINRPRDTAASTMGAIVFAITTYTVFLILSKPTRDPSSAKVVLSTLETYAILSDDGPDGAFRLSITSYSLGEDVRRINGTTLRKGFGACRFGEHRLGANRSSGWSVSPWKVRASGQKTSRRGNKGLAHSSEHMQVALPRLLPNTSREKKA
ncbi:hypothetical protein KM043_004861 [Ampulex compressa]|nr:hypothetical protein KM043_004861 [Ampulex compressa]